MRVCIKCNVEKPLEDFYNRKDNGSGKRRDCKVCNTAKVREYRKNNRDYLKEYDKKRYKTESRKEWIKLHAKNPKRKTYERKRTLNKYNITPEQYLLLLELHDYRCAICREEEVMERRGIRYQLAVDHNHKTGKFRCLLCTNCNRVLGLVKENIELLETMVQYLKHFNKEK